MDVDLQPEYDNSLDNESQGIDIKIASYSFDQDTLLLLYKTFIIPNLNFFPVVWHNSGKCNTSKIEHMELRALWLIFNDKDSDYHSLLVKSNLSSLETGG